jgi:hypothetical protein
MNLRIHAGKTELAEALIHLSDLCEEIYSTTALGTQGQRLRALLDGCKTLAERADEPK